MKFNSMPCRSIASVLLGQLFYNQDSKHEAETMDKTYIGKVEAFEIAMERDIDELPRKGEEKITVPAIATRLPITVLGKDSQGFYLAEMPNI